jgi:hypothetical protein
VRYGFVTVLTHSPPEMHPFVMNAVYLPLRRWQYGVRVMKCFEVDRLLFVVSGLRNHSIEVLYQGCIACVTH